MNYIMIILIFMLAACDWSAPKEPPFLIVTDCVSNTMRNVEVCNNPIGTGTALAVGGYLLLGPLGLLAGAPSVSEPRRCHMERESYCEKYETKQIPNKNYKP